MDEEKWRKNIYKTVFENNKNSFDLYQKKMFVEGEGSSKYELILLQGDIIDKAKDGSIRVALHSPWNKFHNVDKIWIKI